MSSVALISVVDDDESVRESLEGLLKVAGFKDTTFAGAKEFLTSSEITETDCLILNVPLGPHERARTSTKIDCGSILRPIVFISAHGDAMMADGAKTVFEDLSLRRNSSRRLIEL